ncbi:helix-turn-helix domain-containing protein [Streptomyces sp. NPDC052309]|uniref:nSTAND1 domain-containing NTPase n=1 Tax=Streptomyces sp. NPDC052309 TaxID=3155421 RepID=UPI00342087B5
MITRSHENDDVPDDGTSPHPAPRPGQELRRLRVERGLSLGKLAARIHYTKGYLSQVENGNKPLSPAVAARCDEVLETAGALTRLVAVSLPDQRGRRACERPPYRGLAPYGVEDAQRFFGRERATTALVRLLTERLDAGPVMVVAASGTGKSSLLRAGMLPALYRGVPAMPDAHRWPALTMAPGERPVRTLLTLAAQTLGVDQGLLAAALEQGPDALARAVRDAVDAGPPGPAARVLLIVDQFEEVFTLCSDEAERTSFVRVLQALSAPPEAGPGAGERAAALVVLGMRADFYGSCLAHPELAAALRDGQLPLEPMRAEELREAVLRPAEVAGLEVEAGLVELVLRDLGAETAERTDGGGPDAGTGTAGPGGCEPGALPLCSHALLATWQERSGQLLTVETYQRAGGIAGSVAATAERAYGRLSPAQRRAARAVLLRLVRVDEEGRACRRHATRAELSGGSAEAAGTAAEVVEEFTRARLLTADENGVTLAHEAVLRAWPRLREWFAADAVALRAWQQLSATARQWAAEGDDPAFLPRGNRLIAAREAAEHPLAVVGDLERAFLDAAVAQERAEQDREQRRTRRLYQLLAVLAVLLVLALISTGVAVHLGFKAMSEQRTAHLKEMLAYRAGPLIAEHSEASLLLAAGAWRQARTPDSESAVLSSQADPYAGRLPGHDGRVRTVAWSPDRDHVLSGGMDDVLRIWDVRKLRQVREIPDSSAVRALAVARENGRVVWGNQSGVVTSMEGLGGRPVRLSATHRERVTGVAVSDDGRIVLSVAEDGVLRVTRFEGSDRPVARAVETGVPLYSVALTRDGRTAAVAGRRGAMRLVDLASGRQRVLHNSAGEDIWALAFTPDGRRLIAGEWFGNVAVWDVGSRNRETTLTGLKDSVVGLALSPDGRYLAAASEDDTAGLWDLAARRRVATLRSHHGPVFGVAYSPDGRMIATGGADGTVRLWTPEAALGVLHRSVPWRDAAPSPDRSLLAVAGEDGSVRLVDTARRTSRRFDASDVSDKPVRAVAFSHDGAFFAGADDDGRITVWRTADPRRIVSRWKAHDRPVTSLSFGPGDRLTLASSSEDHTVGLWELPREGTGEPTALPMLTGHSEAVYRVLFLDRDTLATGALDREVRIWSFTGSRRLRTFTDHQDNILGLAVSPQGVLATAGRDHSVKLWDAPRRGGRPRELTGHTQAVTSVSFNPSGTRLVTTGRDDTVRIWDTSTGRLLLTLTGHRAPVSAAAFLGDDGPVVSASEDATVRWWSLDTEKVFRRLCRAVGTAGPAAWKQALPGIPYEPGCR